MNSPIAPQGPPLGGPPPGISGAPPGAMPPSPAPPGMPGMMPPTPMLGGAPQTGAMPGLAATIFQDLSTEMPHHYQLFDAADRLMKVAINTGGFYKQPKELAVAQEIQRQTSQFIANYGRANLAPKGSMEAPANLPEVSDTESSEEPGDQGGGE